jgi:hypothetical protein
MICADGPVRNAAVRDGRDTPECNLCLDTTSALEKVLCAKCAAKLGKLLGASKYEEQEICEGCHEITGVWHFVLTDDEISRLGN